MRFREIKNASIDIALAGAVIVKKAVSVALADTNKIESGAVAEQVEKLHPLKFEAVLSGVFEETKSSKTLRFESTKGSFPVFRAGQFVSIAVNINGVKTARAYSISSPPSRRSYIDLTVRRVSSPFVSSYLTEEARIGDVFDFTGPAGCFYYEPLVDSDKIVFLAGGSGITPFMSIIREIVETDSDIEVQLVYGCRKIDDIIFKRELQEISDNYPNIDVGFVISEPEKDYKGICGMLDSENISSLIGSAEDKTFFICGPDAMYDFCERAVLELGAKIGRIRKEISGPPLDVAQCVDLPEAVDFEGQVELTVEGQNYPINVNKKETLLNSLERNGLTKANLCRSGSCGVCRTKLISGAVFMPKSAHMKKADSACGYIHPCVAYPVDDLIIRL